MVRYCRVCGSDDLSLYYTQGNRGEFKFYRCGNCSLVNYDLIDGFDQGKYSEEFPDPEDMSLHVNRSQTSTFRFIRRKLKRPGLMLDVGCGNGRLLHLMHKEGWMPVGLELSDFLAQKIRERLDIDVKVGNFLDFNVADDDRFDLIVMRHVLEHMTDPLSSMIKMNTLLRDGAFGVLEFPNINALDFKLKRLAESIGIYHKKYGRKYMPGHASEFCKQSFKYLCSKTGFRLESWRTYSSSSVRNLFFRILPVGSKARAVIRKITPA